MNAYSPKPNPIPLDPRNLTMKDAMHAMSPVNRNALAGIQPNLAAIGAANPPRDPEREAFDKWWDQKSAEPLNYKDIKHYAWAAWIESHHRTITEISAQVESLKKGKV